MVWLASGSAKCDRQPVFIITDRTELDEQIEKVFSGKEILRTKSGADLVTRLVMPITLAYLLAWYTSSVARLKAKVG